MSTRIAFAGCVAAALVCALPATNRAMGNEFTLFAPDQNPDAIAALSRALCPEKPADVEVVDTIQKAIKSKADVLVLFLSRQTAPSLVSETISDLRTKKILGIGYGAAKVFGDLGLEINGGACAHDTLDHSPEIAIQPSPLCPEMKGRKIVAFRIADTATDDEMQRPDYNFAMYLPRKHETTQFVEAIARWKGDDNYAPIVQQGNHILVGLAAPPQGWTMEYTTLITTVAGALAKSPSVPFTKAEWDLCQPGEYEFELAEGRSTNELFDRVFHFRFEKPVVFSASLQQTGSASVMVLFMGEGGQHWSRRDGKLGENPRIDAKISKDDIERIGAGYWSLKVTNFDRDARPKCKLSIEY